MYTAQTEKKGGRMKQKKKKNRENETDETNKKRTTTVQTLLNKWNGSSSSWGLSWSARFHSTPPPAALNFLVSSFPIDLSVAGKL